MDILKQKIGGDITIGEASGTIFMQWVLRQVNTLKVMSKEQSELISLANVYPGQSISDERKLEIVAKMQKAGISI